MVVVATSARNVPIGGTNLKEQKCIGRFGTGVGADLGMPLIGGLGGFGGTAFTGRRIPQPWIMALTYFHSRLEYKKIFNQ